MKVHFFTIATQSPEFGQKALSRFFGQHSGVRKVIAVEKHFVDQVIDSFWSICVTTIDSVKPEIDTYLDAMFDPFIILFVGLRFDGKKQSPSAY